MPTLEPVLRSCADRIDGYGNIDGGWPYYAGKQSRLEPTAWTSLARTGLAPASERHGSDVGRAFFAACQRADGLLVDPRAPYANLASHANRQSRLIAESLIAVGVHGEGR